MRALFQVPFAGLAVIISSNKLRLTKRLIKDIQYIHKYNDDGRLRIYTLILINLDNKLLANLNLHN